jgi:hypothetical protein
MEHTDHQFAEIRLSRAFAVEFEKFWRENPQVIPPEVLKAYMLLKQEYEWQINRNLS